MLSWAARCANNDATKYLLERGADLTPVSRFGSTALHYAAGARSPGCIIPLLDAGANPNTPNACLLETPLHVPALRHDEPEDFLMPLILHGADVNACDYEGSSILAFAVQAGHYHSAKYLLDHGADINSPDKGGLTPLGLAVIYNHHELLEILFNHGANESYTTEAGETLLHLCALHGDLKTIEILARRNLEIMEDAHDLQGMTAMDHAQLRGIEFAKSLRELFDRPKLPQI